MSLAPGTLVIRGGKPVAAETIRRGDNVLGAAGAVQTVASCTNVVSKTWRTREWAEIVVGERKLLVTATQTILTPRGWMKARSLRQGDLVVDAIACKAGDARALWGSREAWVGRLIKGDARSLALDPYPVPLLHRHCEARKLQTRVEAIRVFADGPRAIVDIVLVPRAPHAFVAAGLFLRDSYALEEPEARASYR